jgi:hypothetical protein
LNSCLIAVAVLLSQSPAASPDAGEGSATTKALVKGLAGAVDTSEKKSGPDVSKMPFTPDSVRAVVVAANPQIQGCYEQTLAVKDKAIEGRLETSFLITADGTVAKAAVDKRKSNLKEPELHECVVTVLSALQFPKPPDGKPHPIRFPFALKAEQ